MKLGANKILGIVPEQSCQPMTPERQAALEQYRIAAISFRKSLPYLIQYLQEVLGLGQIQIDDPELAQTMAAICAGKIQDPGNITLEDLEKIAASLNQAAERYETKLALKRRS